MADVTSFADACQAAERTAAIFSYVQDKQRHPEQRQPRMDTTNSRFRGQGPMVLGATAGQDVRQPGRRQQADGRRQDRQFQGQPRRQFQGQCYNCGKHGHMSRDCWHRDGTGRSRQPGSQQQGNHQFMGQYLGSQQQGNFQLLGSQQPGSQLYSAILPPPPLPYVSQPQVQDPQPKNRL